MHVNGNFGKIRSCGSSFPFVKMWARLFSDTERNPAQAMKWNARTIVNEVIITCMYIVSHKTHPQVEIFLTFWTAYSVLGAV